MFGLVLTPPRSRADWLIPASLFAAALTLGVAAGPAGAFPINDDWSYSAAARALLEQGRLAYTDWTSMPLLPQILIGAAFGALFGASETVLRMSTLTVTAAGLVALYFAAREVGARPGRAGLLAACVLVSPVFFSVSLSFMTDSFFFAFLAATCWAWLRYARTESATSLSLGTLFAVLATLQRQLGLALPLAFAAALVVTRGWSGRVLRTALLPLAVVALAHVGYGAYVERWVGRPLLWDEKIRHLVSVLTHPGFKIPREVLARSVAILGYTGITFAPLLLPLRVPVLSARARLVTGALVAVLGLYVAWLRPPFDSLVHQDGVGLPLTPSEPSAGFLIAWRIVIFSGVVLALGAAIPGITSALGAARRSAQRDRERWFAPCFLLSICVVTLSPLLPILFFDRYLLGVLPLFGILIAARHQPAAPTPRAFSLGYCAALAAIAVVTTQDSFAWNRARWRAIEVATASYGAAPEQIDAGFEYNERRRQLPTLGTQLSNERPRIPELDARYVVSFGPRAGYEALERFRTGSWLHGSRDVLLLERRRLP